jgi:DNA primase
MGISEDDIARVRAAVDFVAVAAEHIALKKVGRQYQGLCPFHSEKSPSFSINPEKGVYFCYGCGAKGDVITFVRDLEHLDFTSAVERLAAKANITLTYVDDAASRDRIKKSQLVEVMEQATAWYHDRLLTGADAGKARAYLRSRGYDGEAIKRFRIGWAPDGWDTLCRALKLSNDVARDTGLGYVNKVGKLNDFFQARILFPIFDATGSPIAFGGRKLPDAEGPKYKNSSETKLYSKSRTLYGLNWAKASIVAEQEVIVCEGYTDVIGFHRAGLPRAVATCGTALADEHFRTLKNFARRIVLAYDADSAGQSAAAKFYAWERAFEIDLFVVALPPGADPGDMAREDPEGLAAAVKTARPFLQFRIERLLGEANLKTAEGRARAFERAALLVLEHPNALVREQYLRQVAGQCQISEDAMAATLQGGLEALTKRETAPRSSGKRAPTTGPNGEPLDKFGRPKTLAERPTPSAIAAESERIVANEDPGYEAPPDLGPPQGVPMRPGSAKRAAGGLRGRATSFSTKSAAASTHAVRAELEALRWAVSKPDEVLPWLDASFFADAVVQRAFRLILEFGDVPTASDAVQMQELPAPLDAAAIVTLHKAAVETPSTEADDAIALLIGNTGERVVSELTSRAIEGEVEHIATMRKLKLLLEGLHETNRRANALSQLVPWLSAWSRHEIAETPETT